MTVIQSRGPCTVGLGFCLFVVLSHCAGSRGASLLESR